MSLKASLHILHFMSYTYIVMYIILRKIKYKYLNNTIIVNAL